MSTHSVAVLVGSLRRDSLNRKMAQALGKLAPASLRLAPVAIGELPFFNQDLDGDGAPEPWVAFRKAIAETDALLFVTPEYNRSVPAVLKNAIDVGSRPAGKSVWRGKPGAVISVSPGAIGGFGANHHLRQSLVCLDVAVMAGPEAYIGSAGELFDDQGDIKDERRRTFLDTFMQRFADWIASRRPD